MIAQMHALTNSIQLGHLFSEENDVFVFESDTVLGEVFDSFTQHCHDAVLITENTLCIGILTLKDMMRVLQNLENLLSPVREFIVSPLLIFESTQSIADVLDLLTDNSYEKIVVKDNNNVIGIMDIKDLLSLCYSNIAPLIKHEYNLIHSVLGLAEEGGKRLLKLATTDPLTGVGNRRLLEEVFKAHQLLADIDHSVPYLLLFDIDDFKPINDTHGHNIGDSVLKELTTLVSNSIRKSDILVRWGGEEFAILFRYSDATTVLNIAEQIRQLIDQYRFELYVHITCSFGFTAISRGESLKTAIGRADLALYRAKAEGKNTIRMEKH